MDRFYGGCLIQRGHRFRVVEDSTRASQVITDQTNLVVRGIGGGGRN